MASTDEMGAWLLSATGTTGLAVAHWSPSEPHEKPHCIGKGGISGKQQSFGSAGLGTSPGGHMQGPLLPEYGNSSRPKRTVVARFMSMVLSACTAEVHLGPAPGVKPSIIEPDLSRMMSTSGGCRSSMKVCTPQLSASGVRSGPPS
jgi:hypothetical protein